MSTDFKLEIDFDKKCKTCFSYGACPNGLCVKCSARVILAKLTAARKRAEEKPEDMSASKSGERRNEP